MPNLRLADQQVNYFNFFLARIKKVNTKKQRLMAVMRENNYAIFIYGTKKKYQVMVHVYFCAKSTGVQVVFLGGVNVKHIFSNISSVLYL